MIGCWVISTFVLKTVLLQAENRKNFIVEEYEKKLIAVRQEEEQLKDLQDLLVRPSSKRTKENQEEFIEVKNMKSPPKPPEDSAICTNNKFGVLSDISQEVTPIQGKEVIPPISFYPEDPWKLLQEDLAKHVKGPIKAKLDQDKPRKH